MKQKLTDAFYEDTQENKADNSLKLYEEYLRKFVEVRTRIFSMLQKAMPDIHILDEDQLCTYLHNTVSPRWHGVAYCPNMEMSDYLFDGEIEFLSKSQIALVVSWNRHNRTFAVAHQHIIGNPDRNFFVIDRINSSNSA